MFNTKHYIPILKWKAAEQQALEKLSDNEKNYITPMIQIIMPRPKIPKKNETQKTLSEILEESIMTLKVKLPLIADEILKFWGKGQAFIDFSLIDQSLRKKGFEEVLKSSKKLGLFLVPVISLNSDSNIQKKVVSLSNDNKSGLCLKLTYNDINDMANLAKRIKNFLNTYNYIEANIDLLIDSQDVTSVKFSYLNQQIPNILSWRTFTFSCGSFPVDLTKMLLGKNYIQRNDWNNWITQRNSQGLIRVPAFGDYTILHPIYKEMYQFFTPSASIRYTLKDKWLIMRGQKGENKQYLAYAQLLSKEPEFFGESFSYGDSYIVEKGKNLKGKPGNAKTWLIAGINHHLVCTIDQIANLP